MRAMTKTTPTEELVQVSTRIPKALHRQVKLHIVQHEGAIQTFVEAALREKLAKERRT